MVAREEGDRDSDEENVGENIGDEPGVAKVARAGACGERNDDVLHHEVDGDSIAGSAEPRLAIEEFEAEAGGVVDVGHGEGNEIVEEDSEEGRGDPEAEDPRAEEPASDGLGNGGKGHVLMDGEKDDGESEIEGSGDKAGGEDSLERELH